MDRTHLAVNIQVAPALVNAGATALSETRKAALVALFAGLALVYTVGFAMPNVLHDAAHDTRHTMSFPCH